MRPTAYAAFILATIACASPGIPPGGPIDTQAPQLIGIAPDSGRTGVKPSAVVFRFDEVVTERPPGVPSLDALFLISPRDGSPSVDWHRSEISVHPRRGWKANTPYTITMLPGIADLRGNVRNTGAVTMFSTGPTIPQSRIAGTVVNWINGSAAARAFVEAMPVTDTTTAYVAVTDSTGRFVLRNVPPGNYRVRGIIDDNNNKGLDPREAWDTVTVSLVDSINTQLLAFAHDSIAPRLISVGLRDSSRLELVFDRPLDPTQTIARASVSIKTSDSTVLAIDSLTLAGGTRDTAASLTAPPLARPIPPSSIIAKLSRPLTKATTIRVRAINIRSLDRVSASTERVEAVDPNPPKAAPAAAPPPPPPPPAPIRRKQ